MNVASAGPVCSRREDRANRTSIELRHHARRLHAARSEELLGHPAGVPQLRSNERRHPRRRHPTELVQGTGLVRHARHDHRGTLLRGSSRACRRREQRHPHTLHAGGLRSAGRPSTRTRAHPQRDHPPHLARDAEQHRHRDEPGDHERPEPHRARTERGCSRTTTSSSTEGPSR
jgi:hypothetical protein